MGLHTRACALSMIAGCTLGAMELPGGLTRAWTAYGDVLERVVHDKAAEYVRLLGELEQTKRELAQVKGAPTYEGPVWDGTSKFLDRMRSSLGVDARTDLIKTLDRFQQDARDAAQLVKEVEALREQWLALADQVGQLRGQFAEYSPEYVAGLKTFVRDLTTKYTSLKEGSVPDIVKSLQRFFKLHTPTLGYDPLPKGSFELKDGMLVLNPGMTRASVQNPYQRVRHVFEMMTGALASLGILAQVPSDQLGRDLNFALLFDLRSNKKLCESEWRHGKS